MSCSAAFYLQIGHVHTYFCICAERETYTFVLCEICVVLVGFVEGWMDVMEAQRRRIYTN